MILTERQMLELEVARISTGEIPKKYSTFNDMVWKIFQFGRKVKELEIEESKAEAKEG